METHHKTRLNLVFFVFLFLFFGVSIFARWNIIQSPIVQEKYNIYIAPHLKSSPSEILLSKHHRQIQIYKNAFSNILYQKFGVNEITFRAFSTIASLLTLVFIFLFTQKTIGCVEATIAVLLFGVSYYSFLTISNPYYGSFYIFGSFVSFYYLFKGLNSNRQIDWWFFGIFSFLNITNVLLAGLTLPIFFVLTIIFFLRNRKFNLFSISELKSRFFWFLVFFSLSTLASLWWYYLRGLNLLGAFWDIAVTHEVDPKVNADNLVMEKSFHSGLIRLFYTVFVTFNFEHGDGSNAILGIPEGPWIYFALFLLGFWRLYISHRELFWQFLTIFIVPILISGIVLRISEARFLAFIHPFHLILVAIGFTYCFHWLKNFISTQSVREGIILTLAFLLFTWGTHPKPLWATPIYDELFKTKGIREFRDYLRSHIKENDVILNVASTTELRTEIGDAHNLLTYDFYLKEFQEKHRMELLPLKTGRVGIWLFLIDPLTNKDRVPFYFPRTYSPKLIDKGNRAFIYYGEINIPETTNAIDDFQFTTPFWSFMKGLILQNDFRFDEAKSYYKVALKYGLNLERVYNNLSILELKNMDLAFEYIEKAIKIIETPTSIGENDKVQSWETYGNNEKGLPDLNNKLPRLRQIYIEKNGIKYKKWLVEDLIKARPYFYAKFYEYALVYLRALYLKTNEQKYLDKIKELNKKGSQIGKRTIVENLNTFTSKNNKLSVTFNSLDLNGIAELYPPIRRN